MKNRKKYKFTVGISYEKHLKKAKKVYEDEVRPLLEKDSAPMEEQKDIIASLTPAQKAHLNCQNHI